jgi:hypothetical protein
MKRSRRQASRALHRVSLVFSGVNDAVLRPSDGLRGPSGACSHVSLRRWMVKLVHRRATRGRQWTKLGRRGVRFGRRGVKLGRRWTKLGLPIAKLFSSRRWLSRRRAKLNHSRVSLIRLEVKLTCPRATLFRWRVKAFRWTARLTLKVSMLGSARATLDRRKARRAFRERGVRRVPRGDDGSRELWYLISLPPSAGVPRDPGGLFSPGA